MRVESDKNTANGGWLHRLSEPIPMMRPPPRPAIVERPLDLEAMWEGWQRETDFRFLDGFAMSLSVDTEALQLIGCAWNGIAWAFQMKNAKGEMIGIRLRANDGRKWAVRGSKSGLFVPSNEPTDTVWICEGPTDTAAALTLGLCSIGRPACLGCEDFICEYIQAKRIKRIVIVTDNDEPGLRGAHKLQKQLSVMSCIWIPPTKDLREFISLGGDRALIDASLKDLVWTRPRDRTIAA